MTEERIRMLMDATGGIRGEYVEEAVQPRRRTALWLRLVAAAAALILVVGATMLLSPQGGEEQVPFFAIRAYAADGSEKVLNDLGEAVRLKTGTSDLFPGKTVYVMDISLEYYDGDFENLDLERLWVHHSDFVYAPAVKPDEWDHNLSMQWLTREEDGMYGIRLIGWCEERDNLSFKIWDKYGTVICEKELIITWNDGILRDGYEVQVRRSFSYREDMTTDELIDVTLRQDYSMELLVSSSAYGTTLAHHCGFSELCNRPDAASKLLERYERYVNGETVYPIPGSITEKLTGGPADNAVLIGNILHWSKFQAQMTEEEKALLAELEQRWWEIHKQENEEQ